MSCTPITCPYGLNTIIQRNMSNSYTLSLEFDMHVLTIKHEKNMRLLNHYTTDEPEPKGLLHSGIFFPLV
jgi:hypothetical protein